ncbi:MAG TPA: apolipoprotein N-acyltransferase [Candidatus Binatus sp.]|nr:apolipoprotein N-acyltransferase [Candidatus Binatus sp.]
MTRTGGRLVASAVAGALTVLALSPRGCAWLAWVALVPLFAALAGATRREAVGCAVAYTMTFALGGLEPWFARATSAYFGIALGWTVVLTAVPLAVLAVAHGSILGAVLAARPRPGPWDVVWCGAVWTCWETLRVFVIPYYPAAFLGLSQHATIPVLQLASLTGVAGVTFVIVAFNVGVASLLSSASRRRRAAAALTGLALAAGTVGWGALRVARAGDPEPGGPRIVAIDIDAPERSASTLERYLASSAEPAATHPALLVWPESALAADVEHDRPTWTALDAFVATHGTALLAGGPGSARRDGRGPARFNSAHLLSPGHGMQSYHKRGLVPFAERWPAILGAPPADLTSLDAGEEATVFPLGDSAFGVLICFEITDAAGARDLARGGARFIVNITNDAWFAASARPPHLPWAAVRAVETGLPVVRAANAGVSGVFDRFGRQVAFSRPRGGPAVLAANVPPPAPSLYARRGDLFLAACVVAVLAGLASSGGSTPRRTHRRSPA